MKNNNLIRISEKHGVNPSLTVCFWCGEHTGIALLGKLPGDKEAPKEIIADYEPCDKCKEQWNKGIPIIEVSASPKNEAQMPISNNNGIAYYPTGCVAVIKEQAINPELNAKPGSPMLMIDTEFRQMFPSDNN